VEIKEPVGVVNEMWGESSIASSSVFVTFISNPKCLAVVSKYLNTDMTSLLLCSLKRMSSINENTSRFSGLGP
jgi:hypothetical protein